MKLHDLAVFCAVAEEESFVNAAHRLFVSQSAVTQHIKKIETELGFPLLIRNKHFVKITAQGIDRRWMIVPARKGLSISCAYPMWDQVVHHI